MPAVASICNNVSPQWKTTREKEVGVLVLAKMEKQVPDLICQLKWLYKGQNMSCWFAWQYMSWVHLCWYKKCIPQTRWLINKLEMYLSQLEGLRNPRLRLGGFSVWWESFHGSQRPSFHCVQTQEKRSGSSLRPLIIEQEEAHSEGLHPHDNHLPRHHLQIPSQQERVSTTEWGRGY